MHQLPHKKWYQKKEHEMIYNGVARNSLSNISSKAKPSTDFSSRKKQAKQDNMEFEESNDYNSNMLNYQSEMQFSNDSINNPNEMKNEQSFLVKNEANINNNNYNNQEIKKSPLLENIPFGVLIKFYNTVQQQKKGQKKKFVQRFLDQIFKISRDPSFSFTVLRMIIPHYDKARQNYGLNQKNLAKVLAKSFSLTDDAMRQMQNYKRPLTNKQQIVGDFGEVVQNLLEGWNEKSTLTINQVDRCLDQLSQSEYRNLQDKEVILRNCLKEATPEETKWISRLILKDLNLGVNHEIILALFHKDAVVLYNTTSSLWEVCKEFVDPNHSLSNVVRLFHPIKPMLAGRKQLKSIESILQGKNYLVETKFDGERIQCHISPDTTMFFTRNSNNYTNIYEKMIELVRSSLKDEVENCILDGEMVVVNRETGQRVQFGMNKAVAFERQDDHHDLCICYKIFDILYLKTKQNKEYQLTDYTIQSRKTILSNLINNYPDRVEVILGREYSDISDILTEFNEAVQRNDEGIVIKQLDTLYYPDDRSDKWIKMKGDYYEGIVDTLDLIVIGGYFGEKSYKINGIGDWTDHITHYLLAVSKRIDTSNPQNSILIPFAKVATGFTARDYSDIKGRMREQWVRTNQAHKVPSFITSAWKPNERDKPDAYISSPEHSIILEIRATEIISSNNYPTNYTLRFPRFERLRRDKDWAECMTLHEILDMTQNMKKKERKGSDDETNDNNESDQEDNNENKIKKKRKGQNGESNDIQQTNKKPNWKTNKVMAQFQDTDVSDVKVESNLFANFIFNIINLPHEVQLFEDRIITEKSKLERDIVRYGGNKVQNDCQQVTHYIASHYDFKVETIAYFYKVNVLSLDWVRDSIKMNKLQDYSPRYIIYAQQPLIERNKMLYDKYGDPYYRDVEENELKDILDKMDLNNYIQNNQNNNNTIQLREVIFNEQNIEEQEINETIDELKKLKEQYFIELYPDSPLYCLFNKQYQIEQDQSLKYLVDLIIYHGGRVTYHLNNDHDDSNPIHYLVAFDYSYQENEIIGRYLSNHKNIEIISVQNLVNMLENHIV